MMKSYLKLGCKTLIKKIGFKTCLLVTPGFFMWTTYINLEKQKRKKKGKKGKKENPSNCTATIIQ